MKVDPRPGPGEDARTSPWCAWASPRAIVKPIPLPPVGRVGPGNPVEAVEDELEVLRREADAGVGHRDAGDVTVTARGDDDATALRRVGERVAAQVGQHLHDPIRVDVDRERRGRPDLEFDVFVLVLGSEPVGARLRELTQIDPFEVEHDCALFRARQLREIGGQALEARGLLGQRGQHLFVRLEHLVEHALDEALDGGERCAHLVRDLADQSGPAPFGGLELHCEQVHVARELGELQLCGLLHRFVVVAGREPARRTAHLSHRTEDLAGHEHRHDRGGGEARGQRVRQRRPEGADEDGMPLGLTLAPRPRARSPWPGTRCRTAPAPPDSR